MKIPKGYVSKPFPNDGEIYYKMITNNKLINHYIDYAWTNSILFVTHYKDLNEGEFLREVI